MTTISKVINLLITAPRYDLPVFLGYVLSFFFGTKPQILNVYSGEDLLQQIISGHSIIRFGDGEAMLMTGRNIHYQNTSPKLNQDLRAILATKNKSIILALPVEALASSDDSLAKIGRLRIWRLFRCFAKKRLNWSRIYADAHSFYRQEYLKSILPKILANKHVICISKKSTLDETLNQYLKQYTDEVTFIESLSQNSYNYLSDLEAKINISLSKTNLKPILLLSTGPTSKVLAYHFAQKDIQSIDIGHGLEIVGRDIDYSDKI